MIKGCILPWMHLFGSVDGKYRLCCHIFTPDEVSNYTQPISTVFNNEEYKKTRLQMLNGEVPYPCDEACYKKERLGGESNRQQVNKRFKQFEKFQKFTRKDGSVPNNPIYIDIRFGNKCNFKCRICGPHSSSTWFKDAKNVSVYKNVKAQLEDYYTDSPDFWNYLDKIKKSIRYFYFAGGEPLIMDGHYKVLNWLIDNNKTDVELTYNTNLSTLTYKDHNIFELWSHFNKISLWPSVDGYKEHCEYGRTNFKWDNFESNLKKVKKYVDTITCTTSIYSILTTPELVAYLKSLGLSTHLSVLGYPRYLDMRLLPNKTKNKIMKKFDILKSKINLMDEEIKNINTTISYLNNDAENKEQLLRDFKNFNVQVDKINNTSFIATYPELKQWYETI